MKRTAQPATARLAALFALLLAGGCSSGVEEPTRVKEPEPAAWPAATSANLVNTRWKAVSILGKPTSAAVSTLEIDAERQVAGHAGCNRYRGEAIIDDSNMDLDLIATSRKLCTPEVSRQNTVFLDALGLARAWKVTGDTLMLLDENSAVVVRFKRQ